MLLLIFFIVYQNRTADTFSSANVAFPCRCQLHFGNFSCFDLVLWILESRCTPVLAYCNCRKFSTWTNCSWVTKPDFMAWSGLQMVWFHLRSMKQFLLDVWTQQQPPASAVTGVSIERPQHFGELHTYRGDTWYNIYFTNFSLKVSKPCITFSAVLLCSACLSKNKVVYLFEILFLLAIWLFHHVTALMDMAPSATSWKGCWSHPLCLLTSVSFRCNAHCPLQSFSLLLHR